MVLATSGVGHALVSGLDEGVGRVDPFAGLEDRPASSDGLNFLVVGVDDRAELSAEQRRKHQLGGASCNCTDTLMMVHLSADRERMSVVSLPRDTYVKLPKHTHEGGTKHQAYPAKINSAYTHGGPNLTVRTVEKMTGVHIDHYLEVSFRSFMNTVDVLGGVPVCTVRPLKDERSGLDLPAGQSRLDATEALAYVRARHLGGSSDFGRMQRQQQFIASVIDRATSSGVLMNPAKLNEVASTLLRSVRADPGFGTSEIVALGRAMRDFTPASSEFVSVPVEDADYPVPGLGSTVKWDEGKADKLFDTLRADRPLADRKRPDSGEGGGGGTAPSGGDRKHDQREKQEQDATPVDIAPNRIRVQVANGTEKAGLGHRVDTALRETDFDTTGIPRNAERQDVKRTVITYDPRWNRSVRTLQAALPGAELREEKGRGPAMLVTVGKDFDRVRAVRAADPRQGGAERLGAEAEAVTGDEVTCG
ncbi:LytR family transcriptional regulator [Streptomyces oceani]|uniref:LytR family transcriptional regulator n=1 Tax=Streptomyces oceani TaxID=1075402 RepID=A0A1E7KNC6_9ACTN|nr:LytR family transcriptional regulator [Streptomyces oceani]